MPDDSFVAAWRVGGGVVLLIAEESECVWEGEENQWIRQASATI